jgi:hypothetical protein
MNTTKLTLPAVDRRFSATKRFFTGLVGKRRRRATSLTNTMHVTKFGCGGQKWDHQQPATTTLKQEAKQPLEHFEQVITQGLIKSKEHQQTISAALKEVHDRELWREGKRHESFIDWVESKWGKSKSWAYKMMRDFCAEVVGQTPENASVSSKTDKSCAHPVEKAGDTKSMESSTGNNDDLQAGKIDSGAASSSGQNSPSPEPTGQPAPSSEPPRHQENGKPKYLLHIWAKAESCGGAFLRAVDDVHRQCPNGSFRDRVISGIKAQMDLIKTWRESVK